MRSPTILVVARAPACRREIADVLLSVDHVVFCACDASDVMEFERIGLAWTLVVFGGAEAATEAAAYLRRSALGIPVVVMGQDGGTLASLIEIVDRLLNTWANNGRGPTAPGLH